MKTKKSILKINFNGELVESTDAGRTWKLTSRAWNFSDISKCYKKESKENWKKYNNEQEAIQNK